MDDRIQPFRRASLRGSAVGANILKRTRIASYARAGLLAVFAALAGLTATPVAAQTARPAGGVMVGGASRNLFEARAVPVDVTATSVTEARERALTQGRIAGLRQVVEHLAPREDLSRLPNLSAEQIIEMVREFSIANERTSAVRYIAEMNVRYNPDAVRRLLRNARIPFSEVVSKPMIVLPLYVDGSRIMLWEDSNPWREAWAKLKDRSALVPLVLPSGDLQDMKTRTEQVIAKDTTALLAIAQRYEAAGVIVAKATAGAGDAVTVSLTELRGVAPPVEMTLSAQPQAGQTHDDTLIAAATLAADAIADVWKKNSKIDMGTTAQMTALAQVKDLKDWIAIRERLKDVQVISHIDVQAMTRERVQVTLRYVGEQSRLENALAQQSLALNQQGGVWMLSTVARKAAPAEVAQ